MNEMCRIPVIILGSSAESVGEFRFRESAHRVKQCDFQDFVASKAIGFSRNEIFRRRRICLEHEFYDSDPQQCPANTAFSP